MRSDASKGLHDKEDLSRADLCVAPNAAPPLGTTGRNKKTPAATAFCSLIFVEPLDDYRGLFQVTDGYVRRYWTALLDSSAVADLLRIVADAGKSKPLLQLHALGTLLAERIISDVYSGR